MSKQLRALMIGAHPDDCDFRCAGLVAKYVAAGHIVKYISMTDGSGGHHTMEREALRARRMAESQAAAAFMGIEYDVWDIPDGELIADLETRKRTIRAIREFRPDLIIVHRLNDYHPDHRNCAQAVQDASYMLIVPLVCPDVPALTKMPVIMHYYDPFLSPVFVPDVVIGIDETVEKKFDMLACHDSQLFEWLPYTCGTLDTVPADAEGRREWIRSPRLPETVTDEEILAKELYNCTCEYQEAFAAAKYRDMLITRYGEEKGRKIRFAEAFCVSEYGSPLTKEKEEELFPLCF